MCAAKFDYSIAKIELDKIIQELYYDNNQEEPIYIVLSKFDGNKYKKDQTYVLVTGQNYAKVHFIKKE